MIYLNYISSLLLITIGVSISFSSELAEIPFYTNYFSSWTISLIITHLIPSVFIAFGILLLLGNSSKYNHYFSIVFTGIFLLEACITNVFNLEYLNLIILLITFSTLVIMTFFTKTRINTNIIKQRIYRNITILVLLIGALLIPYIISPIASYALVDNPSKNIKQKQIEILNKYIDVNHLKTDSNTIVALFSTNCYYCFEAAKKIGITQKVNSFENVISLFPSTVEDANTFIQDADYSTKKTLCSKKDFIQLTEGRYPKFFVINESITSYSASSFQHRTIDLISR